MAVLVLMGGASNEREVSFRSGRAVINAFKASSHEVLEYDPADGYDGLSQFVDKADCVFPILHGVGGEDGLVQEELGKLNLSYLGSDPEASILCFNKNEFKKLLNKSSILTPKWDVVDKETVKTSELINHPYVLKPLGGGSTIDAYIIRDPKTSSYDEQVFDKYDQMLLEELIVGDEVTVSILDGKALPVIEIVPPDGKEFDFENKYNGATQEICPPRSVAVNLQKKAQEISEKVHSITGCRHLSRVDIMIDQSGRLFVLELNTIPGLTDQSLYPKSAAAAGLPMPELVKRFVDMVKRDRNL